MVSSTSRQARPIPSSGSSLRRAALCWLLLASIAQAAHAHLLNMSLVDLTVAADGMVEVRLALDLSSELGGPAAYYAASRAVSPLEDAELNVLAQRAAGAVVLLHDETRVPLRPIALHMPRDALEVFLSGRAWPRADLRLRGSLAAAADTGAVRVVFAPSFTFEEPIAVTLREGATGRTVTRWLIAGQRSPLLGLGRAGAPVAAAIDAEPVQAIVTRYLRQGFLHILPLGIDHLLFVAGLFLGVRSVRQLVALISVYTVAHSITLGLAAYSLVEIDSGIIEPAIALSIVWVGVENLRPQRRLRWRALLVFALGLVHGLGFAGALRESGLPADGTMWALGSFNVGIELGQLVVLALLLGVTWGWRSKHWYGARIVRPGSIAIAAIGALWTVERLAT